MIQDQRVFFQATDISLAVNDFRTTAASFVPTAGQYLYIGSVLPFNNMFFELGTLNANAATVSIDMWWGNAWVPAVDILDETAGLTASGRIQWNTDINKSWDLEQYSKDVTGLPSTSNIYNMYWLRMSWSASFSVGTTLKYVGQKFANDDILYSFYPDMNNSTMKTQVEAGKTTWDEQHYMAAEHIVRDLKKKSIIKARPQILDYHLLQDASCHKVAEIVYQAFGPPYFDLLKMARTAYNEAIDLKYFNTDKNADGRLDPVERCIESGFGTR